GGRRWDASAGSEKNAPRADRRPPWRGTEIQGASANSARLGRSAAPPCPRWQYVGQRDIPYSGGPQPGSIHSSCDAPGGRLHTAEVRYQFGENYAGPRPDDRLDRSAPLLASRPLTGPASLSRPRGRRRMTVPRGLGLRGAVQ